MIVELDGRISELQNQQIMNQEEQNQLKRQKAQEGESVKVYVAAYSSEKGIIEEASEIFVDLSILENSLLREVIDSESEIGGKSGLKFYQNKDGEDESDKDDVNVGDDNDDSDDQDESTGKETNFGEDITEKEKIEKKVQNYYLRILFYAFLSEETEINNLTDVINSYDNNQRLARHIGLEKNVLEILAQELRQPYVRSDLDNKISNANALLADDTIKVSEKVGRAIQSFKRISESEVFTPRRITELMIDGVVNDMDLSDFNEHPKKFIDLASKSGIYLLVLYEKLLESNVDENIARKSLYAIATSSIAYEFTRKVFELMEFPVENILDIDYASSYDLINENNREYTTDGVKQYYFKGDENMKFDVVVGNPPYNESISATGGNSSLSKQLFPSFIEMATSMGAESVSLITPSRWFTADAQDRSFVKLREYVKNNNHFKKIYSFPNSKQIFPGVEIAGGVSFFIFKSDYEGNVDFIENYSGSEIEASRPLFENGLDIIIPMNELVNILRKVSNKKGFISMTTITKGRNAFGIVGKKYDLDKITL